MIQIDHQRCGYCGSCISVCPVEALSLSDAYLTVAERCTSCGRCVAACPVTALSLPEAQAGPATPLRHHYDVVVVGAGPAGSTAARYAAQAGLSVLLVDRRQEIGAPVQCAEGVAYEQLRPFVEPDPRWISATIRKASISCAGMPGLSASSEASGAQGCVLERRVFDRALAELAVDAGARCVVKTQATGLLLEGGAVRGVRLEGLGGRQEVAARIVVAADGVGSLLGRWAGLPTRLPPRDLMTCAQYLMAGIDIDPECTYYYLDETIAPGGYAWIFPKGQGRANVGLGVQSDLAEMPPVEYLNRFVERYRFLAQGSPVCLIVGGVPVSRPLERPVADGLMVVGDAARQVDPLTGGGIANGMTAGRLAAEVAVEAVEARDTSAAFLARYGQRWSQSLGRKMERNYAFRQRFPVGQRASERFMQIFAMAVSSSK